MIAAALIGCGRAGWEASLDPGVSGVVTHAHAYAEHPSTRLEAVCDTNLDRARRCAERYGVNRIYSDVEKMLREIRPEIVSIATPNQTHAMLAMRVARQPGVKAVLIEKPLAESVEDARAVARVLGEYGIISLVNYTRRFAPFVEYVENAIQTGLLGRLRAVSGWYTKGIIQNGSHWIDLARRLFGEIISVRAWPAAGSIGDPDPPLHVFMSTESLALNLMNAGSGDFALFEMDIVGSAGRMHIRESGYVVERFQVMPSERWLGYNELRLVSRQEDGMKNAMLRALNQVVERMQDASKHITCTAYDGVRAIEIADRCIASARQQCSLSAYPN